MLNIWLVFKEFELYFSPSQGFGQDRDLHEIVERSKEGALKEKGREPGGWEEERRRGFHKGRTSFSCLHSTALCSIPPSACALHVAMEAPSSMTHEDHSSAKVIQLKTNKHTNKPQVLWPRTLSTSPHPPHLTPICANLICPPVTLAIKRGHREHLLTPNTTFKIIHFKVT